jgi:hypothetical protein
VSPHGERQTHAHLRACMHTRSRDQRSAVTSNTSGEPTIVGEGEAEKGGG